MQPLRRTGAAVNTHLGRWWHRHRLVGWWQRRYGRGFYLGQGPGGAHYLSRAEAVALRRALESGDVPRRTVRRIHIDEEGLK